MLKVIERKFKAITVFTVVMLLIITTASLVFAEGSKGGGEGKDEPLSLVSSNPADGQKDVPVDTQIKLVFSKNVVNMSVKDNNQKCFSLMEGAGKKE